MLPNNNRHDLDLFFVRLGEIAAQRRLAVETLGTALEDPILYVTPRNRRRGVRRLLVGAGFHGYEIAGPWAILHFLESAPDSLFGEADLSFLPVVNPWGFRNCTRWNRWGQDPNDGYCPPLGRGLSAEGRVLMAHGERLLGDARDGALMLHGDLSEEDFYLYTYEWDDQPTDFSFGLREAAREHFPVSAAGDRYGDPMTVDGVIYCLQDGSFEDWLFRSGSPRVATTETPGRRPFHARVVATAALVERFVADAIRRARGGPVSARGGAVPQDATARPDGPAGV